MQLFEREKAAGLVSNLSFQTRQTLNRSAYCAKMTLNDNPTATHHLMANLIQTTRLMIMKHPQNGSSKGISTLLLVAGPEGNLMKTQFGQRWRRSIHDLPTVPIPVQSMESFYNWAAEPNRELIVETADSRKCTGKVGEQTTMEKMHRSGKRSRAEFR